MSKGITRNGPELPEESYMRTHVISIMSVSSVAFVDTYDWCSREGGIPPLLMGCSDANVLLSLQVKGKTILHAL